jgi:hypothetical protein
MVVPWSKKPCFFVIYGHPFHAMGIVISTCLKKCYTIYIMDLYTLYVKKKWYIHPYPCLWLLIDDHLPMLYNQTFDHGTLPNTRPNGILPWMWGGPPQWNSSNTSHLVFEWANM